MGTYPNICRYQSAYVPNRLYVFRRVGGTGSAKIRPVKRPMVVSAGDSAGIPDRFRARRELYAAALILVFVNFS